MEDEVEALDVDAATRDVGRDRRAGSVGVDSQ